MSPLLQLFEESRPEAGHQRPLFSRWCVHRGKPIEANNTAEWKRMVRVPCPPD